jgi:hypothetical protein
MQHTKFCSFTAHKKQHFIYQVNFWILQYPLLTVVVLRQYHKNFSSPSNNPAHQK